MWRWCARQHCAPRVCIPSHCTILPFFFYLHSLDVSRSVLAELSRQHEVIFGARGRLMDTQSTATERDGILSLVRIFLYCMCAIIIMVSRRLRLPFLLPSFSLLSLFLPVHEPHGAGFPKASHGIDQPVLHIRHRDAAMVKRSAVRRHVVFLCGQRLNKIFKLQLIDRLHNFFNLEIQV